VVSRIENAQFFNIGKIRNVAGRQLVSMTDGDRRNLCAFGADRSADALAVGDDLRVMSGGRRVERQVERQASLVEMRGEQSAYL